jgi:hypothetical protein
MKPTPLERFEAKFVKRESGCWIWTASLDGQGYGHFYIDGVTVTSSRAAYRFYVGPIPEGPGYHGTCVLHKCDNPLCVNPEHLFLGSNFDNVKDMDSKGRRGINGLVGDRNPRAKVTNQEAREIYDLVTSRVYRAVDIARLYGVAPKCVSDIKHKRTWGCIHA